MTTILGKLSPAWRTRKGRRKGSGGWAALPKVSKNWINSCLQSRLYVYTCKRNSSFLEQTKNWGAVGWGGGISVLAPFLSPPVLMCNSLNMFSGKCKEIIVHIALKVYIFIHLSIPFLKKFMQFCIHFFVWEIELGKLVRWSNTGGWFAVDLWNASLFLYHNAS